MRNTGTGYGYFETTEGGIRRSVASHRTAYELWVGLIPEGLSVLHKCDYRPCINPDHLFVGTQSDNHKDMVDKKRHAFGERNNKAKLIDEKVLRIRKLLSEDKLTLKEIGDAFDVDMTTIHRIYQGKTWKHLGPVTWPVRDLTNRLTDEKVMQIKFLLSEGLSQNEIASRFSIDQTTVSDIKRGKRWKHLYSRPVWTTPVITEVFGSEKQKILEELGVTL